MQYEFYDFLEAFPPIHRIGDVEVTILALRELTGSVHRVIHPVCATNHKRWSGERLKVCRSQQSFATYDDSALACREGVGLR